ncbi:hypothetical protein JAAARDRAFT_704103 [Jaapia argillacea MUCL 33604]|uniref:Restriction of telomere capping protein 4 C-terminal domain-containing protein n=1 Tax=Jaapia argillacea MUCL 33604 TaxID=933084 RepID=A0A067PKV5_9AGAM|nr:hypothetical protein JAAARDRAFT_704103 [Jaapia argillacea MUCL 33604]
MNKVSFFQKYEHGWPIKAMLSSWLGNKSYRLKAAKAAERVDMDEDTEMGEWSENEGSEDMGSEDGTQVEDTDNEEVERSVNRVKRHKTSHVDNNRSVSPKAQRGRPPKKRSRRVSEDFEDDDEELPDRITTAVVRLEESATVKVEADADSPPDQFCPIITCTDRFPKFPSTILLRLIQDRDTALDRRPAKNSMASFSEAICARIKLEVPSHSVANKATGFDCLRLRNRCLALEESLREILDAPQDTLTWKFLSDEIELTKFVKSQSDRNLHGEVFSVGRYGEDGRQIIISTLDRMLAAHPIDERGMFLIKPFTLRLFVDIILASEFAILLIAEDLDVVYEEAYEAKERDYRHGTPRVPYGGAMAVETMIQENFQETLRFRTNQPCTDSSPPKIGSMSTFQVTPSDRREEPTGSPAAQKSSSRRTEQERNATPGPSNLKPTGDSKSNMNKISLADYPKVRICLDLPGNWFSPQRQIFAAYSPEKEGAKSKTTERKGTKANGGANKEERFGRPER